MIQAVRPKKVWISVAVAVILVILLIDSTQIYLEHRKAQTAADLSVLAAVRAKDLGKAYIEPALRAAAVSGYNNDGGTNTVEVFIPPVVGDYAGADGFVQVVIKHRIISRVFQVKYEDTV